MKNPLEKVEKIGQKCPMTTQPLVALCFLPKNDASQSIVWNKNELQRHKATSNAAGRAVETLSDTLQNDHVIADDWLGPIGELFSKRNPGMKD